MKENHTLYKIIEAYSKDGGLYLKHNQRLVLLILVGSVFQMGSIIEKINAENETGVAQISSSAQQ